MNRKTTLLFLLGCGVLYFALPFTGMLIRWQGTVFPDTPPGYAPGYGIFPAVATDPAPGFNLIVFIAGCIVAGFMALFILIPALFGFKKTDDGYRPSTGTPFPFYFLPSLIIFIASWIINWARWPEPLDMYIFVPLWWSFILLLDAIVYKRNYGRSIFSTTPTTFKLVFAVSSVAWWSFEYLNYFFLELWYYPNADLFTSFGRTFWYLLSFTVVWPGIFEFYSLLRTFPFFRNRYSQGMTIRFPVWLQIALLFGGFALAFLSGIFPRPLFFALWLYPMLLAALAMSLSGKWTIFRPITQGNWSFVVLIGLATLANGFFYELWNEGSLWFHPTVDDNPNYWSYNVPYVNVIFLFSQMPLLGYFGYIAFGSIVWSIWLYIAEVIGFSPKFDPTE